MKGPFLSVVSFAITHPGSAFPTLLQGSQIRSALVNTDCPVLVFFGIASLLLLTFVLVRYRHRKNGSARLSLVAQVQQQRTTIEQQQQLIDEQREQLQALHAMAKRQSHEDTRHLASMYQELTQANQDIEIFLYKAYHNFLGPIATIRGICNIATMESREVSSLDYFGKVSTVADNMHNMLEQLLEVSVIHDRELTIEPTNLDTLFEGVSDDLVSNASYHSVRFRAQFADTPAPPVDGFLLHQAIVKIVNNTMPFRREGFGDQLELAVTYQEEEDHTFIVLKDYHLSIPEDISSDIFRMFYRGTYRANDHGLGLYTARYAMRRMGGDIAVTTGSSYTTFYLKLPKRAHHPYQNFLETLALTNHDKAPTFI